MILHAQLQLDVEYMGKREKRNVNSISNLLLGVIFVHKNIYEVLMDIANLPKINHDDPD